MQGRWKELAWAGGAILGRDVPVVKLAMPKQLDGSIPGGNRADGNYSLWRPLDKVAGNRGR